MVHQLVYSRAMSETLHLDQETSKTLHHLADAWGVSPEEAVRRALISADVGVSHATAKNRLEAFKALQQSLQLTPEKAAAWQAEIIAARR